MDPRDELEWIKATSLDFFQSNGYLALSNLIQLPDELQFQTLVSSSSMLALVKEQISAVGSLGITLEHLEIIGLGPSIARGFSEDFDRNVMDIANEKLPQHPANNVFNYKPTNRTPPIIEANNIQYNAPPTLEGNVYNNYFPNRPNYQQRQQNFLYEFTTPPAVLNEATPPITQHNHGFKPVQNFNKFKQTIEPRPPNPKAPTPPARNIVNDIRKSSNQITVALDKINGELEKHKEKLEQKINISVRKRAAANISSDQHPVTSIKLPSNDKESELTLAKGRTPKTLKTDQPSAVKTHSGGDHYFLPFANDLDDGKISEKLNVKDENIHISSTDIKPRKIFPHDNTPFRNVHAHDIPATISRFQHKSVNLKLSNTLIPLKTSPSTDLHSTIKKKKTDLAKIEASLANCREEISKLTKLIGEQETLLDQNKKKLSEVTNKRTFLINERRELVSRIETEQLKMLMEVRQATKLNNSYVKNPPVTDDISSKTIHSPPFTKNDLTDTVSKKIEKLKLDKVVSDVIMFCAKTSKFIPCPLSYNTNNNFRDYPESVDRTITFLLDIGNRIITPSAFISISTLTAEIENNLGKPWNFCPKFKNTSVPEKFDYSHHHNDNINKKIKIEDPVLTSTKKPSNLEIFDIFSNSIAKDEHTNTAPDYTKILNIKDMSTKCELMSETFSISKVPVFLNSIKNLVSTGSTSEQKGRYFHNETSILKLKKDAEVNPNDEEAWIEYALKHLKNGITISDLCDPKCRKITEACNVLIQGLKWNPKSPELWNMLLELCCRSMNVNTVRKYFMDAVKSVDKSYCEQIYWRWTLWETDYKMKIAVLDGMIKTFAETYITMVQTPDVIEHIPSANSVFDVIIYKTWVLSYYDTLDSAIDYLYLILTSVSILDLVNPLSQKKETLFPSMENLRLTFPVKYFSNMPAAILWLIYFYIVFFRTFPESLMNAYPYHFTLMSRPFIINWEEGTADQIKYPNNVLAIKSDILYKFFNLVKAWGRFISDESKDYFLLLLNLSTLHQLYHKKRPSYGLMDSYNSPAYEFFENAGIKCDLSLSQSLKYVHITILDIYGDCPKGLSVAMLILKRNPKDTFLWSMAARMALKLGQVLETVVFLVNCAFSLIEDKKLVSMSDFIDFSTNDPFSSMSFAGNGREENNISRCIKSKYIDEALQIYEDTIGIKLKNIAFSDEMMEEYEEQIAKSHATVDVNHLLIILFMNCMSLFIIKKSFDSEEDINMGVVYARVFEEYEKNIQVSLAPTDSERLFWNESSELPVMFNNFNTSLYKSNSPNCPTGTLRVKSAPTAVPFVRRPLLENKLLCNFLLPFVTKIYSKVIEALTSRHADISLDIGFSRIAYWSGLSDLSEKLLHRAISIYPYNESAWKTFVV